MTIPTKTPRPVEPVEPSAEVVDPVTHMVVHTPIDDVPQVVRRNLRLNWKSVKDDIAGIKGLRDTKYGLTPILVLTFVGFCQNFDNAIFGSLAPEIRRDLDISISTLANIATITGVIGIALSPVVGYFSDRRNRVRLLGVSTILSGVFSVMTARAQGVVHVFAARTVDDASEALGSTPASTLVYDYYPVESRGKMVAFATTFGKLAGFAVGPTVGALAVLGSWRTPFYIAGPLLVFSGVLAMKVLREPVRGYWERKHLGASEDVATDPEPPVRVGEALRTVMAIRTLRRNLVASALTTVFAGAFTFLFSFYLFDKFRLDPFERSLVTVPGQVLGTVAVIVGGAFADVIIRYRPSRLLVIQGMVGLVGSLFTLVQVVTPSLWLLVVANVVMAVVTGLTTPAAAVVFAHILPPRLRGLGISLVVLPVALLSTFGPKFGGMMQEAYGLEGALLYLFPLTLIAPLVSISAAKFFEVDMRAAMASAMAKEEYRLAKASGRTKLLVCKDLDVSYGSVQVLFNVDFSLEESDIVALLGTNGAGKSTLLRAISGAQEASNGAVLFDGRDITHLPPNDITKLGVISMPGGRGTFPGLTVQENLDLALWNCPEAERSERTAQVFDFFPVLRERLHQDAALLSGGEQQMVALGQAFLSKPRLLMIDELSLGLSPAVVGQLLDIVRAIHAQGTTIILVEQSVNVALTVAERAVFMEKGEVRFEGRTSDLLSRPELMRSVYLKGAGAMTSSTVAKRSVDKVRPVLEVSHLAKGYGGKVVVDDVSFVLHQGEALGFIGPNGAGKTTLFELISGFQEADAGTVVLDGVDISRMAPDARARAKLIRRFQDARLFPSLTVFETLCVALEGRTEVRNTFVIATQIPGARRSERRVRASADRLVELFELGSYRDKFVADLSTGVRRVVDLACVLAAEPKVLLLDEPSSGIAQAEAENLGPLLRRVLHETGCSLLLIEHDVPLIRAVSDELVGLVQGRLVLQGPADEVLGHPLIVSAYLGDDEAAVTRQGHVGTRPPS